jgi:hypothetical protein
MNRVKEKVEVVHTPVKAKKSKTIPSKYFRYLNVFGIFSKEMLMSVMPYILFLTGIALIYIANSYYAERTIRDIDAVSKELKTLRTEYITGKSELMMISKQSEVARAIAPQELKESVEAPRKIVVDPAKTKSSD